MTQFIKKEGRHNLLLSLSILCLLYFSFLVYNSYYQVWGGGGFRFMLELATIPLLLVLLFTFVFSLVKLVKREAAGPYLPAFLISAATVVMLVVVTALQMQG